MKTISNAELSADIYTLIHKYLKPKSQIGKKTLPNAHLFAKLHLVKFLKHYSPKNIQTE